MSILLLLLLLLLSLHASDARLLRNNTTKQVDQPSNSTIKENEKLVAARVSNDVERKGNSLQNNGTRDSAKDHFENEKKADVDKEERVSWKVPDEKKPQAGFNLDYLPPKTHPPVHN